VYTVGGRQKEIKVMKKIVLCTTRVPISVHRGEETRKEEAKRAINELWHERDGKRGDWILFDVLGERYAGSQTSQSVVDLKNSDVPHISSGGIHDGVMRTVRRTLGVMALGVVLEPGGKVVRRRRTND